MTIAVADSWEGRSTTATLDVPVSGIEAGDILVVVTFCAGSGSADGTTTDDAGNTYVTQIEAAAGGAYTTTVAVSDTLVSVVPTQVSVANSAGGANDVAAVVMRVTHDGTGWLDTGSPAVDQTGVDDPTSPSAQIGSSTASFAGPGSALFIAALTHDGLTTTLAPQSGWTEVEEDEDAASGIPYSVVSRVYTEYPGAVTHQWTTGAARDYSDVILGYTENIADLVGSFVVTAPSPAITGLTLEVDTPLVTFPDPNDRTFHVLATPVDSVPDYSNSEFLRVVGRTGDVWDVERQQAGTRAQAIEVGWRVWWDHIYDTPDIALTGGLMTEVASRMLNDALDTLGWTGWP